jgi:hypothetical protein
MRILPKFKFKVSIHELLAAYESQTIEYTERLYLCNFIEYSLIREKNLFWRFVVTFNHDDIGFKEQWLEKINAIDDVANASHTIEGWVYDHPDFQGIKQQSIVNKVYSLSTFRVLCLRRAAELYPDWVLEFTV